MTQGLRGGNLCDTFRVFPIQNSEIFINEYEQIKELLLFDEKQMSGSKELRNKSKTEHSPDLSEDDNKNKPSTKNSSLMLFDYGGNSNNNNTQTNYKNSIIRQIGLEPYYSRSNIHQTSHTSILDRLKRLKKNIQGILEQ